MPELPEVETTKAGLSPFLLNQKIKSLCLRHHQLRLPIPADLSEQCRGQVIRTLSRRAKYLLIHLDQGYLLIHLGMSGHLSITQADVTPGKHDHIDLLLENGLILRYNDPRRFGLWLYSKEQEPLQHPLLAHLGPEPLSDDFDAVYLERRAQGKNQNIKSFIMANEVVVGIGNIYATESLFLAGINPQQRAGALQKKDFINLTHSIKKVLQEAIKVGGTTLRDFYAVDGKPGYFANNLQVYGRKDLPCHRCKHLIQASTIAGRRSAFCPSCQPL